MQSQKWFASLTTLSKLIVGKTMLTIEECKKHLVGYNLTDKEIETLRNSLSVIIGDILDDYEKTTDQN